MHTMTTHNCLTLNSISTTATTSVKSTNPGISARRSTSSTTTAATMRLLLLSCFLLVLFNCILEPVYGAPLSVRESSLNTNIFKKRVFACKDFNCSILFKKDEVTPELVEELRNNPDTVKDRNPTTPSQAES